MEAAPRFELGSKGFADLCLTTWLRRRKFQTTEDTDYDSLWFIILMKWSGKRDLNPRHQPWQGCTLPLSYSRPVISIYITSLFLSIENLRDEPTESAEFCIEFIKITSVCFHHKYS